MVTTVTCINCGKQVEESEAEDIGQPNGPDGDTMWLCKLCDGIVKAADKDNSPDAPDPEDDELTEEADDLGGHDMAGPDDGGFSMSFEQAERAFEHDRDRRHGC